MENNVSPTHPFPLAVNTNVTTTFQPYAMAILENQKVNTIKTLVFYYVSVACYSYHCPVRGKRHLEEKESEIEGWKKSMR